MQAVKFNDRLKCRMLLEHKDFQEKKGILTFWQMLCRSQNKERGVLVINSFDPSNLNLNTSN